MGWAIGFDTHWDRDVGYGVPATCDHPDCNKEIDRGLSYVCGGEPYGGGKGCGLFFCSEHRSEFEDNRCERCLEEDQKPFEPKPDLPIWTNHKDTDPSWAAWRAEQAENEGE